MADVAVSPAGPGAPSRRWWPSLVVPVIPAVILSVQASRYRWMSDDGFIQLRVVKQLLAGNGPVFNAGERVEASTSVLWVYVLALGDLVSPFQLEWVAVVLGIALTVFGLVAAMFGAARLSGVGRGVLLIPAGALALAAWTPMWKYASGGLEGGLGFAWLGGCCWLLGSWSRSEQRLAWWGAVIVGLGPLVRPDFAIFSAAFLIVVLVGQRGDGWRAAARLIGVAVALPVAYQIFRMGYYASLTPNPALAKEASRAYWGAGWEYLRSTVGSYWLWIPLVVGVATYVPVGRRALEQGRGRIVGVLAAFGLAGVVHATYLTRVGGDFMFARLLVPSVFAILAPIAVVPFARRYFIALAILPWAIVALVALRAPGDEPQAFTDNTRNAVTLENFGWGPESANVALYDAPGVYYGDEQLPARPKPDGPDRELAAFGIGIVSYALEDLYVLDLLGLADPFTSHLQLDERALVAHEKPLPFPWIPARLTAPQPALSASYFPASDLFLATPIDDPGGVSFKERTRTARRVLRCRRITEFMDTYTAPLTPRRFLDNLGAAITNQRFRIPPEPAAAERALCP